VLTSLRRLATPPVLSGEEATGRARTLYRVAWATAGTVLPFLFIVAALYPSTLLRRAGSAVVIVGLVTVVLALNRRGRTRLASWVLIAGLVALVTQRALVTGGISAPSAFLFVILVLIAGLLVGARGGAAVAAALGVIGLGLALHARGGAAMSADYRDPIAIWLFGSLALGLAVVVQREVALSLLGARTLAETSARGRRSAERRLRLAIEAGQLAVWDFDPATELVTADPALFALHGIAPTADGRLAFATWIERVHPDDRAQALASMRALVAGAASHRIELRSVHPDGTVRHVERAGVVEVDDAGAVDRVVGVDHDVTARREAEREHARLVRDLGERVKELSLLHAAAGLLQRGRTGDRRPGADRDLLQDLVDRIPAAWQYPECCEARIAFGDVVVATPGWRDSAWRQEIRFATSEGSGWIEVVYLEERPAAGEGPFLAEERALLVSLADLLVGYIELRTQHAHLEGLVATRTRELVVAKEQAEGASRAKGMFLSTMSHEIRTPMNSILGYAQLLRRDRGLSAEQRARVDVILSSGDHLLTLINNILEMSRIEAGRTTLVAAPFDLHALIDRLTSMFSGLVAGKGLRLLVDGTASLPRVVQGDGGRILQVLINLLGNAVKFTERGTIAITAAATTAAAGHRIRIDVADTGPGIAGDDLARIFGAFEQSSVGIRAGGAGLGLAISRDLARLMGGDLTATSSPGGGSTFSFAFEVAASAVAALPATRVAVRLAPEQAAPRVLVVDDQAENLAMVGELLAAIGFDTRLVGRGEEAIEAHDAWQPALILMDLRMPGIGGIEATRRLRAAGSRAVIVAFTASGLDDLAAEARGVGADDVLFKPYREAALLERLGDWLGVRYVYEASEPGPAVSPELDLERLGSQLARLPPALAGRVRDAAVQARPAQLAQLADEIETRSAEAAAGVRLLTAGFRYQDLATLLDDGGAR
jgi:PAS domain S-box-containing protein